MKPLLTDAARLTAILLHLPFLAIGFLCGYVAHGFVLGYLGGVAVTERFVYQGRRISTL